MDLYPDTPEGVLRYHDRASRELGHPTDLSGQHRLAYHLCGKGQAYEDLVQYADAICVYEEVINRFAGSMEPAILNHVAEALLGKGRSLAKLGQIEKAISHLNDAVTGYAEIADVEVQGQIAAAFLAKGQILEQILRPDEAIQAYEMQATQFRLIEPKLQSNRPQQPKRPEISTAEQENRAKLAALGLADEQALSFSLAATFWEEDLHRLESQVADGMLRKAKLLSDLGRTAEALQVHDQVLSSFPESEAAAEVQGTSLDMDAKGS